MHKSPSQPPYEREVLNYDPNIADLSISIQMVRLTFGCWDFRATMVVAVTCHRRRGLNAIDQAIVTAYNNLPSYTHLGRKKRCLLLDRDDGTHLECRDDEGESEEWLKDRLISAEIIDVAPAQ